MLMLMLPPNVQRHYADSQCRLLFNADAKSWRRVSIVIDQFHLVQSDVALEPDSGDMVS